jgi:hypothetical protein
MAASCPEPIKQPSDCANGVINKAGLTMFVGDRPIAVRREMA